jgi:hypothetical protein
VAKLLLLVAPDTDAASTVYVDDGCSRWVALQVRPSADSAPATVRDLLSLTVTVAIGPPVAVTVTVVSGRTDAVPLAGEIVSATLPELVGEELLDVVAPAAAGLWACALP